MYLLALMRVGRGLTLTTSGEGPKHAPIACSIQSGMPPPYFDHASDGQRARSGPAGRLCHEQRAPKPARRQSLVLHLGERVEREREGDAH